MVKFVFYTDLFIPNRFDAYTIGPIILIRNKSKEDKAILVHETTHVSQFWTTFGLMGILYFFSKKAKLKYEAEAYYNQLKESPIENYSKDLQTFANYLVNNYNLNINYEEAVKAILSNSP